MTARVALVTGGASGIGLASCRLLADAGCRIAVSDLSETRSRTVAAELPGDGHAGYAADVADERQIADLFDAVEAELGPVAVLVTSAGVVDDPDGGRPRIALANLDNWNRMVGINLTGTFLCVRELLRRRAATPVEHGRIITISSMAGFRAGGTNPPAYVASKAGVVGFTKQAAFEAGKLGMTANSVAPGPTDTPLRRAIVKRENRDPGYLADAALGRIGEAEEIAAAVAFLASHEAGYLTGACLDVNGGLHMR